MKIQHERTREILRQYDLFGDLALNVSSKNRKHTIEYKIELINRVNSGESIASVAIENMISSGQLCNWVKNYKELGYNGLSKPKGRPKIMKQETNKPKQIHEDEKDKKIRELEERNAQLEMEVDLLKKLRALVQQRTQQQNKKK
jgi:transposase